MNWLILVLLAAVFGSITIYIDNYISDYHFKGRYVASQKLFFAITYIIISIILAAATGFDFVALGPKTCLLILLSGVLSSLSGLPYYKALEVDDSTNLGIFVQIKPVLFLILGWLFLGESISVLQLVAFFVILLAPLLIVITTKKRSRKIRLRAVFYAFLYVAISVCGHLLFVKESSAEASFVGEISLVLFGSGFGNMVIVALRPQWIKRFAAVYKNSHKKVLRPLCCSLFTELLQNFTYRGALVLAPSVALASVASDSTEPIIIFFLGIIFTLIWPKFGREKLTKKNISVHLAATFLVVIGIILLQF